MTVVPFPDRTSREVAQCGCPIPPEVASGEVQSMGWHLPENHPEVATSDWRGIDGDTLSLIYYSLSDTRVSESDGRAEVSFKPATWRRWDAVLDEIGREIDRRREERTDGILDELGFEIESAGTFGHGEGTDGA